MSKLTADVVTVVYRRRTVVLIPLSCAFLVAGPACSGKADDASAKASKAELAQLVSAKDGPPGAILLTRIGRTASAFSAGDAELHPRAAMRPDDRFRIQSLTKTYVAAAALRLVEQGRLRLSDTVARWLPRLLPTHEGRAITVRQLLQHTSGLSNLDEAPSLDRKLAKNIAHVFPPSELIGLAARQPLDFRAGRGWNYSNTGYLVLGKIIEKATHKPIGSVLADEVLDPLHLSHTTFDPGPTIPGRFAHGYMAPAANSPMIRRDASSLTAGAWAAGAIVSDVQDVASFYSDLLAGKLMSPASLRAMTTLVRASGPYYNEQRAGLGLFRYTVYCPHGGRLQAWGHTGGSRAYSDAVLASRDGSRVVVLVANEGLAPETYLPIADAAYCRIASGRR